MKYCLPLRFLLVVPSLASAQEDRADEILEARKVRGTWVGTRRGGDRQISALRAHSPIGGLRVASGTDKSHVTGWYWPAPATPAICGRLTACARFRSARRWLIERNNMLDGNTMKPGSKLPMFALLATSVAVIGAESEETIQASGTFEPDGMPHQPPVRIDAGEGCVVDVDQTYIVKGTLSGSFDVNFRILVHGPCGYPLGTYSEEWIARGTFRGSLNGKTASANFTYTATVKAGGDVSGQIVLGQGLNGYLRVRGSFSDRQLAYDGLLTIPGQEQR